MNSFNFPPIYLASQSPRRAQLLNLIGVPFEVFLPPDAVAAEALEAELQGESPLAYVQRVAALKAQYAAECIAAQGLSPRPILCADTTVELDGLILAKPVDAADAARMLRQLAGRSHQVHTAVALVAGAQVQQVCVSSEVRFAPMSEHEIAAYVASGEPFGKAGAYAIQGLGAAFVAHVSGSHSAVMGLPVHEVAQLLWRLA
ncbi:MAG: Maf family protein [Formosimonas sp.]